MRAVALAILDVADFRHRADSAHGRFGYFCQAECTTVVAFRIARLVAAAEVLGGFAEEPR
jgi:hypothetical protein